MKMAQSLAAGVCRGGVAVRATSVVVCPTLVRASLESPDRWTWGPGVCRAASGLLLPSLPDRVPLLHGPWGPLSGAVSLTIGWALSPFGRSRASPSVGPPPLLLFVLPKALSTSTHTPWPGCGRRRPGGRAPSGARVSLPPVARSVCWLPQAAGEPETWTTRGDCLSAAPRRAAAGRHAPAVT